MTRIALIVGGGLGMWREWRVAVDMVAAAGARAVYIAINGAGVEHPDPLHHWASQHIDNLYDGPYHWARGRRANGLGEDYIRWSISKGGNVDRIIKHWKGGSSGWVGVGVGIEGAHCDGAIVSGIPLDPRPNPYNHMSKDGWGAYARFREPWAQIAGTRTRTSSTRVIRAKFPDLKGRIRSTSGWTRQVFGPPSVEWIRGLSAEERLAA